MPKRKVISAKAQAASRRNLQIARERYSGKNVILYHRTNPRNAARLASGKLITDMRIFASNKQNGYYSKNPVRFGTEVVKLTVGRKRAYKEFVLEVDGALRGETAFSVAPRDIKAINGRKVSKW